MPDARTMDSAQVDEVFADLVTLVSGGGIDPRESFLVSKMNDASEMHIAAPLTVKVCRKCKKRACECKVAKRDMTKAERERLQARVGLASNVLGLTAGADALRNSLRDPKLKTKVGRHLPQVDKGPVVLSRGGKLAAVGSLALQTGNVVGDIVANRVLAREAQKKVSKALEDILEARRAGTISTETAVELAAELTESVSKGVVNNARLMGGAAKTAAKYHAGMSKPAGKKAGTLKALQENQTRFTRAVAGTAAAGAGGLGFAAGRRTFKPIEPPQPPTVKVAKSDEVEYVFAGEISKRDEDKRLVFGWCNLSTVDGQPVVDLQGDYAPIEEIEKSAYKYVVESRKGGDMHQRVGDGPLHTADLVESFVVTPEKLRGLGVPEEVAVTMPTGWWVGMKVNDDEQWAKVKNGERTGFSVHGSGKRIEKSL